MISRSLNLISSIQSLDLIRNYQLLSEANMTGKYYLNLETPIEDSLHTGILPSFSVAFDSFNIMNVVGFSQNGLSSYLAGLSTNSISSPEYNYIYEYSTPTKVLNLNDKNEIEFALSRDLIRPTYEFSVEKLKKGHENLVYDCNRWINYSKFKEYYSGIYVGRKVFIFFNQSEFDSLDSKLVLVDGNAKRFTSGTDHGNYLPSYVISDLVNYTEMEGNKLLPSTIKWLTENFHKPYDSITLYRGSGINLSLLANDLDCLESEIPPEEIGKQLFKFYGIRRLEDLKLNSAMSLKRGKESSWSTTPQAAQNFAHEKSIKVLAKTTVPASRVLVDFRLVSKDIVKENFRYWAQNEVILSKGKINATVSTLQISDHRNTVRRWLAKNGYTFSANNGFSKIN